MAVALMDKMAVGAAETIPEAAKRFTDELFNTWGVGSKDCGNGVLMLLSKDDKQVGHSWGLCLYDNVVLFMHSSSGPTSPKAQLRSLIF